MTKKWFLKPYLIIFPSFAVLCLFYYYAVVKAFQMSLMDQILGYEAKFIGLDNFVRLFKDPVFFKGLKNMLIFSLSGMVIPLTFPLIAAELLYFVKTKTTAEIIKKVFIFPMLVPGMVVTMLWFNLLDPNLGAFNLLLEKFGLVSWQHSWFFDKETALWSIISIGFPYIAGLNFLIFHNALNSISKELVEASILEGCTSYDQFRYLHIPMIVPYIGTVSILAAINSFGNFGSVLVTTNGGPGYETYVPALIMFNNINNEIGYASAVGVFLFVLMLGSTLLIRKVVAIFDKT